MAPSKSGALSSSSSANGGGTKKNGLISSYFAPKGTAASQQTSASSKRDEEDDAHARKKRPISPSPEQTKSPPSKVSRTEAAVDTSSSSNGKGARAESGNGSSRMDRWKMDDSSPTSAASTAASRQAKTSRRPVIRDESLTHITADSIAVEDEEDDGKENGDGSASPMEGVEEEDIPGTSRFQRFAATTPSRSGSFDAKGKGRQVDTEEAKEKHSDATMLASLKRNKKGQLLASDGTPYTPLETQYLELRKRYPGVLLCVEVGYKFKFYGDDAHAASRELNIACFMDKHLWSAVIPTHRLHYHVKRLLAAGHKVGVIRQTETRALKAASTNASKPFTRDLTELYTASTWVDSLDIGAHGGAQGETEGDDEIIGNPSATRSLVSLFERREGASGPDERVSIGLVAIQVSTGNVTYDQFTDGNMRPELETRLAHLQPAEIIAPSSDTLSKQTDKLLKYIAGQTSSAESASVGRVRLERIEASPSYNEALSAVSTFYAKQGMEKEDAKAMSSLTEKPMEPDKILSVVVHLPQLALVALAGAIKHLDTFNLASIFRLATNFASFGSRNEILLSGNTLSNLEIFHNNTDGREKGSLLWLLASNCKTAMGRRLLKRWLGRPLTNIEALRQRSEAVGVLAEGTTGKSDKQTLQLVAKLPSMLQKLPDLERGLARLSYDRATPTELATIFLTLHRLTREYTAEDVPEKMRSDVLQTAFSSLPKGRQLVEETLSAFSTTEARNNNKRDLFTDPNRYPQVQDAKDLIAVVDSELEEHLVELRKFLRVPRLKYATVAQEEYLIEVRTALAKQMPEAWQRINSTKAYVRYRTPTIVELMKKRNQLQETLDKEADKAFAHFTSELCEKHYSLLRSMIVGLGTLDALASLANVARLPGYSRPTFVTEGDCLELEGFRHPMTETLQDNYVPNDISLGKDSKDGARGVLLTGSNMGGKSSTVRAIALIVVMAQLGSFVPASSAKLSLRDAVLTRMGASDELAKGRSTFMVEVQETCDIMSTATARSLVILDELGRGTSTHDGTAIAEAVLVHLLSREVDKRPTLFFVTHFANLGKWTLDNGGQLGLRGMHMAYLENPAKEEEHAQGEGDEITFLYKLKYGLARKSFGIHCARLAGLPRILTQRASEMAEQMEVGVKEKRGRGEKRRLVRVWRRLMVEEDDVEEDEIDDVLKREE